MLNDLKNAIISNGWNFPATEVKRYYALRSDGKTGIVMTQHYGKIYFSIINPWKCCPKGEIIIEKV